MDYWIPIVALFAYLAVGGVLLLALSARDAALLPDVDLFGLLQIVLWPLVIGTWLLGRRPTDADCQPAAVGSTLIGRVGTATTTLRPWGKVTVDEKIHDVRAREEIVEAGTRIEIIAMEKRGLVVRAICSEK